MAFLRPTRSPMNWLRRAGLWFNMPGPLPTYAPRSSIVHQIPVLVPLPQGELLLPGQGRWPPDRGRSDTWSHGAADDAPQ